MCMIVFAYKAHPGYRLILAANRDEYYDRPTEPAQFWVDHPQLLSGKDVRWGGTWLGITRQGKLASVTNYRDMSSHLEHGLSRGLMLCDYLLSQRIPESFLRELEKTKDRYNGYNLLLGNLQGLYYSSNQDIEPRQLPSGVYGLSNHLLDTPWPKLVRCKTLFRNILSKEKEPSSDSLLGMLTDRKTASDDQLPDTGIGLEWERLLSSIFIAGESYGTRSSTILLIRDDNRTTFTERSFRFPDDKGKTVSVEFTIEP
ncbi:NRDE family protein [bacterium]|nr:MAG: NRDE family protein [bacterium]